MIGLGVFLPAVFTSALAAGPVAGGEALWTPADPASGIDALHAPDMVACQSGGGQATECELTCRVVFNYASQSCKVTCISGYYACCNCDSGCKCVMDHEEMWPVHPEPPRPRPVS